MNVLDRSLTIKLAFQKREQGITSPFCVPYTSVFCHQVSVLALIIRSWWGFSILHQRLHITCRKSWSFPLWLGAKCCFKRFCVKNVNSGGLRKNKLVKNPQALFLPLTTCSVRDLGSMQPCNQWQELQALS